MNIFKKVTSLLCASALLLPVLVGCGGTDGDKNSTASADGKESLEAAIANTSALTDSHTKGVVTMNMSAQGQTLDVVIDMESWQKTVEGSTYPEAKVNMNMDLGAAGGVTDVVVYMKDDSVYMEMQGQKVKMSMDAYAASGTDMEGMANLITPEMIKSYTLSETSGKTVYDVVLDDAAFQTYLDNVLAESGQSAGSAKVSKLTTTITVEGDYVTSQNMSMDMEISAEGITVPTTMAIDLQYISPGEDVKIDFPDFTDYIDMSGATTTTTAARIAA